MKKYLPYIYCSIAVGFISFLCTGIFYNGLESLIRYRLSFGGSFDHMLSILFFELIGFYFIMSSIPMLVAWVSHDIMLGLRHKLIAGILIFLTGLLFLGIRITIINFYSIPEISSDNFKSYLFEDIHVNLFLSIGFFIGAWLCKFLFKRQFQRLTP